jgi:methylmalonyl-CoA/ethylmalonyl-CoA epimerase
MIVSLDHIAIAVESLPDALNRFVDDLKLQFDGQEDVPSQKTTTAFLRAGETHIELVHPMNGEGPIAAALAKRGPGLHHLCFRSDDLDADVARLRERGWQFTSEAPTAGAHGTRVMFVHPRSTGGVLIELSEHPRGEHHD